MKQSNIWAALSLLLTAAIWGLSYSEAADAMDTMSPLFFVFLRYLLGAAMLLPWLFFGKRPSKSLIFGGVICGICLAGGEILQQYGLLYTSAGKAGFLTALYVIMIPLLTIFGKNKATGKIWIASLLSVAGAYLLCTNGSWEKIGNKGDILMIICALFFAFQFIAIAKFAPKANPMHLAAVQFLTVAILSGGATWLSGESCSIDAVLDTARPLLFCGLIAIGFACTVQIIAQKYVHPATCSIILSGASVFGVLWGHLLRDEEYTTLNLIGCGMIFAAIVLVQLPGKSSGKSSSGDKKKNKSSEKKR